MPTAQEYNMHQIIKDHDALLEFVEWLPDTTDSERYLIHLQARKKLFPALKSSDKSQLKRVLARKKDVYRKIKQLQCPLDSFETTSGQIIPTEALVVYITPNPRCMVRTGWQLLRELATHLEHTPQFFNPHSVAMSVAHRSKSRAVFVHFDLDFKSENGTPVCALTMPEIQSRLNEIVGPDATTIIKTRGGCHVLVKPELVVSEHKNWFPILQRELNCDQSGDLMLPCPGAVQGDSIPIIVQKGV